jgi:hypothetical protein
MSFYQIANNPKNVAVKNPELTTQHKINFLLSGFQQPDSVDSLTDITTVGAHTYSAAEIINRYTVRTGLSGSTTDTTCTAAQLVAALNANQSVHRLNQVSRATDIWRGFYFDWSIYNESSEDLYIEGGVGVNIGGPASVYVAPSKLMVVRVIVTNATEGSEEVYISILTNL